MSNQRQSSVDSACERQERSIVRRCVITALVILFGSSALRHAMFLSTGWDLALFDQATYLISIGETPFATMKGYHIFGDHGSPLFYPLSLLYRIWPTPYWLLLVQAAALSLGAWPVWRLTYEAGIERNSRLGIAVAYLLYPLVFNSNLDDFHPDVIAPAAMLAAVLAARRRQPFCFAAWIVLTLSCKAILGLTVGALGLWLFLFENRRSYGLAAAAASFMWFAIVTFSIIPALSGGDAAHFLGNDRFAYLGQTIPEILRTVFTRPWVPLQHILSVSSLGYVAGLLLPILIGLDPAHLAPLVGAAPQFLLNLLSQWRTQRHVTNHYQFPILPFLFLAMIAAVAAGRCWARNPRLLVAWSLLGFLIFARYPWLVRYAGNTDSWQATRTALAVIHPEAGVLADNCLLPHVAHRRVIHTLLDNALTDLDHVSDAIDLVFLNTRHPCNLSPAAARQSVHLLLASGQFASVFERDGVIVLKRKPPAGAAASARDDG